MHRARAARPRGFDSLPSLSDVGTFSHAFSLALFHLRKQKYQNGNIHRKLKVPTSTILLQP
jgi:hypothetical protein